MTGNFASSWNSDDVRPFEADDVAGKFHDSALHSPGNKPRYGTLFSTGILDSADLAFDTAVAEAAGNDDTVHALKKLLPW